MYWQLAWITPPASTWAMVRWGDTLMRKEHVGKVYRLIRPEIYFTQICEYGVSNTTPIYIESFVE